jgi:phenylalanyl-tRNA synthetase alpha chain
MLEQIDKLQQQADTLLEQVTDAEGLEQFRIRFLGSKGELKGLMGLIGQVPKDDKKAFGQGANALKAKLQAAYEQRKTDLEAGGHTASAKRPRLDLTQPGIPARRGRKHVITQTIDQLLDVFGRMGFEAVTGPEVEDEFHNFVALNIPATHPARDPLDNFYIDSADADPPGSDPSAGGSAGADATSGGGGGAKLLRSQTSTVQIRVMENQPPPVKIVSVGRVYRPDEHDATHYSMFHQVEGLHVDKGVTMADLKTTLVHFARAMFGPDTRVRLVPSYFPFTEPSAELYVEIDLGKGPEWVELGGCGMVDPAVFGHVGYDPDQWTGFAFGLGVERIAMRRYQIPDIRLLFENDLRFLRQF